MQVAARLTPASASDVLRALLDAGASDNAAKILTAQSDLETASWTALTNYNLGFVVVWNDTEPWFLRGTNPRHFRSYDSLPEGARAFIVYMKSHGAYAPADAGDVRGFVRALSGASYLTPGEDAGYDVYEQGIRSRLVKLGGVSPSPSRWLAALALITLGLVLDSGGIQPALRKVRRAWA